MRDVSLHLIDKYRLGGCLLVLLQPTSPFRKSEDLERAIDKYFEGQCGLVKAVTPVSKSLAKCGTVNGYLRNITGDNGVLRIDKICQTFSRLLGLIICLRPMIFLNRKAFPMIKYLR